jgi:lipopolysaccharide/colanic/teichoic acid biosynthesis glycosyltransferase
MLVQRETSPAEPMSPPALTRSMTPPPPRWPRPRLQYQPGAYLACKRAADFVLGGILLVLTAPLILVACLLVKLTSRGPVFYSQVRLGLAGRPFTIYKIRTMQNNCERLSGPRWASVCDPRVTRVGRLLRLTHLDELPQFWNVFWGDMSLIGPRPERPEFVPQLEKFIPFYRDRLLVRPGLTGLAQVQLPADSDLESVRRKLARDLFYVQRVGLVLDVKLMLATAFYLARIPFAVARFLLRVPSGAVVENAYVALLSGAETSIDMEAVA